MKIDIDIDHLKDFNPIGELLRALTFKDKDGCYKNFKVNDTFHQINNTHPEYINLYNKLDILEQHYLEEENIIPICYTNTLWTVMWYWDGDGTLLFNIQNLTIINDDCKKTYGWEQLK